MADIPTIKYRNNNTWVDILHPVGSFYFSTDSTSPADIFGGTWTQVINATLRGATDTGYVGSDEKKLNVNNMPSHRHNNLIRIQWKDAASAGPVQCGWFNTCNFAVDAQSNYTDFQGGVLLSKSCSTLTTVICGSGRPNHLFGGDVDAIVTL